MSDTEVIERLDLAYKQYLQILRPYLAQLVDQNLLNCCNSWLQRLSSCAEDEKKLRNQYILTMCCQLSKGMLSEPFNKIAPIDNLENLASEINSDATSETECDLKSEKHITNFNENDYCNKSSNTTTTEELNIQQNNTLDSKKEIYEHLDTNNTCAKQNDKICCMFSDCENNPFDDSSKAFFDSRATSLIMKLREIKNENAQLHHEITALKYELSNQSGDQNFIEAALLDNSNDECICKEYNSNTVMLLKTKLNEMNESRNKLIESLGLLREQLDHYEEMKKHEIDDLEAKFKLEVINLKTLIREECNCQYRTALEAYKTQYENKIKELSNNTFREELNEKDNQIEDMRNKLKEKDSELVKLKKELELHREQLQSVMEKYLEKQTFTSEVCNNDIKNKSEILEKRLSKMEKSKTKTAKLYESRLAYLQREKHLSDTTYQLQLIRQKAQITCEMVDENQAEINASMEKLEAKYKEIVANVQATAIQRRVQDQNTLDALLQTIKELQNNPDISEKSCNLSTPHRVQRKRDLVREEHSCFCQGDKNTNLVSNNNHDDSFIGGFCLDSEKMCQLFNKFNIPQKDTTDTS